jgi:hypothetical protein
VLRFKRSFLSSLSRPSEVSSVSLQVSCSFMLSSRRVARCPSSVTVAPDRVSNSCQTSSRGMLPCNTVHVEDKCAGDVRFKKCLRLVESNYLSHGQVQSARLQTKRGVYSTQSVIGPRL